MDVELGNRAMYITSRNLLGKTEKQFLRRLAHNYHKVTADRLSDGQIAAWRDCCGVLCGAFRSLPEAFGDLWTVFADRFAQRRLEAVRTAAPEQPVILADGQLLWRVFSNLLSNIYKYAMDGTRVYLSTAVRGGSAVVTFRNISGEALNVTADELTERFVRGDRARSGEGSGLGLSIAKSLTELMGGDFSITVDGDLFKVELTFPTV